MAAFLFFGFLGLAVMSAAAVSLLYYTGTDSLRVARIAFRFAVMLSSGALGIYFLSLQWQNPTKAQFLRLLGDYALGPLLSWGYVFLIFPIFETFLLSKSAADRRMVLGIDLGLAVSQYVSVGLVSVFGVLFATE